MRLRCALRLLVSLATAAVLLYSVVRDVPHSWRLMRGQRRSFAGYTATQRAQAFGTLLPLPMDVFAWYRDYLRPGDRFYVQVQNGAFGEFIDKAAAVRMVARFYLLPAIEVSSPARANVVLSFDSDPDALHLRYSRQTESGQQLIYVSRIARGA